MRFAHADAGRRAARLTRCCCSGWHHAFANPLASSAEDFETKRQRINRLQEGQPFGEVRAPRARRVQLGPNADACCHVGRALHAAHVPCDGRGVQDTGEHAATRLQSDAGCQLTGLRHSGSRHTRCLLT